MIAPRAHKLRKVENNDRKLYMESFAIYLSKYVECLFEHYSSRAAPYKMSSAKEGEEKMVEKKSTFFAVLISGAHSHTAGNNNFSFFFKFFFLSFLQFLHNKKNHITLYRFLVFFLLFLISCKKFDLCYRFFINYK